MCADEPPTVASADVISVSNEGLNSDFRCDLQRLTAFECSKGYVSVATLKLIRHLTGSRCRLEHRTAADILMLPSMLAIYHSGQCILDSFELMHEETPNLSNRDDG